MIQARTTEYKQFENFEGRVEKDKYTNQITQKESWKSQKNNVKHVCILYPVYDILLAHAYIDTYTTRI